MDSNSDSLYLWLSNSTTHRPDQMQSVLRNAKSYDLWQNSGSQQRTSDQTIQMTSFAWEDEDDENREKPRTMSGSCSVCCGVTIGSLVCAIALAVILTIWLPPRSSKSSVLTSASGNTISTVTYTTATTTTSVTSTSSTSTTTSATTSSSTTTSTSTSTSTTTTVTTTTTITTTTSVTTSSTTTATTKTSTSTTTSVTTTTTTTTTTTSDTCNILRWNKTGTIVAGTGNSGTASNQLNSPHGIYIDSNDTLYICDYNNNRIQKWIIGASAGSTIAGNSNGAGGSSSSELRRPIDLTFDKNGNMYVVEEENHRVQSFAPGSTVGVMVAGNGNSGGSLNQLRGPSGIAIDEDLNLYITDTRNERVMKWAANATTGTVFVAANLLKKPHGIIVKNDSSDHVYVSDRNDESVQLWSIGANQPNQTVAGVSSSDLNGPTAIKFDMYNNLYVANELGEDVRKFCAGSTVPIVVVGGTGTTPALGDPFGIAFDSNYNLYVADAIKDSVIKFSRL